MVIFLIFLVALLFFSPCFSDPCPSAISCNTSFEIQYPFCVYNDSCPECDDPKEIGCCSKDPGYCAPIHVRCNGNDIKLSGPDRWLKLENILYSDSTLITSDGYLHQSLLQSNCRNATIVFEPHIDNFQNVYHLFSSIQCDPKTHRLPDNVGDHGRKCLYDTVTCSASPPFSFW